MRGTAGDEDVERPPPQKKKVLHELFALQLQDEYAQAREARHPPNGQVYNLESARYSLRE